MLTCIFMERIVLVFLLVPSSPGDMKAEHKSFFLLTPKLVAVKKLHQH